MADLALEAAAEALTQWRRHAPAKELMGLRSDGVAARVAVAAYLDSLLGGLPEEAVEAAMFAWDGDYFGDDERRDALESRMSAPLAAFLRSLRSGLERDGE